MLVVTRKKDEKLMIGDDIEVQVLRIGRENVRLGIKAPANVSIYRYEIYEAIQQRAEGAAAGGAAPAETADGEASTESETPDSPRVKAHSES